MYEDNTSYNNDKLDVALKPSTRPKHPNEIPNVLQRNADYFWMRVLNRTFRDIKYQVVISSFVSVFVLNRISI